MNKLLNQIHNLDALKLMAQLPNNSIDMVLTSPPYDNLRDYKGFTFPFEDIAQESFRVLKSGGVLVWVVGDATIDGSETGTSFRQALYFMECGFRLHDTMIYQKNGSPFPSQNRYTSVFEYMFILSKDAPKTCNLLTEPSKWAGTSAFGKISIRSKDGKLTPKKSIIINDNKSLGNVWRLNTGYGYTTKDIDAYQHPAMFPEELARRHIHTWSNEGDIVLDYFMGSGTTAKLARNMNRQYIGCDISEEYVEIAKKRLQNTDPYQATILSNGDKQLSLFKATKDEQAQPDNSSD